MRSALITTIVSLMVSYSACATDFYVDAAQGNDTHDGSLSRPWQSLQHVLNTGRIESRQWEALPHQEGVSLVPKNPGAPIKAGDTIWLHSGYYGDLAIADFYNTGVVTIAALTDHVPRFRSVKIRSGSHWALRGLHVSPEFGSGDPPARLISIESHGFRGPVSHVLVEECVLESAADTSRWSAKDWNQFSCNGIQADGTRITIRSNQLKNVNFGISVDASHSLIEHNTVENFAGDGLRGLGDHSVFQYNLVKNCYDVNANHDDGFQSWSRSTDGVGKGEVRGMVVRGNTIINYEDSNQPHRGGLQGIGCFDGTYVDWVIENNVVIVDHWHGITLLGARNCRIVNNTVMDPNNERPGPAGIRIDKHKNGNPSTGCTIRNNLTTALNVQEGDGVTVDHNVIVDSPAAVFKDAARHDLTLRKNSQAIDAGFHELAPDRDILGTTRPQGDAIDIGAYEYPAR